MTLENLLTGIAATFKPTINIDMSNEKQVTYNIEKYESHYHFGKPLLVVLLIVAGFLLFSNIPSCSTSSKLESQVRQWAKPYPTDVRNRWAWCYLDSAENWSTDTKLREDVRFKSGQVLTADERHRLTPLDNQIFAEVERRHPADSKKQTGQKETYEAVGNGLKVATWIPPPEEKPPPSEKTTPERRRLFRR